MWTACPVPWHSEDQARVTMTLPHEWAGLASGGSWPCPTGRPGKLHVGSTRLPVGWEKEGESCELPIIFILFPTHI